MSAVNDLIINIRQYRASADSSPLICDSDLMVAALLEIAGGLVAGNFSTQITFSGSELITDGNLATNPTLSGWTIGSESVWSPGQIVSTVNGDQEAFFRIPINTVSGTTYVITFNQTVITDDSTLIQFANNSQQFVCPKTGINSVIFTADFTGADTLTFEMTNEFSGATRTITGSPQVISMIATSALIPAITVSAFGIDIMVLGENLNNTIIGYNAGSNNSGNQVLALGVNAGFENSGDKVIALGYAAYENTGDFAVAIGDEAGYQNTGTHVQLIGDFAGWQNHGNEVVGVGALAAYRNIGSNVVALGGSTGSGNEGDNVLAIGPQCAAGNLGSNVIAIGFSTANVNHFNDVIAIGASAQPYAPNSFFVNQNGPGLFSYKIGTPTTLATLPAANTTPGMRGFITDATLAFAGATVGTVVVGGGGNFAPVYSDGANWRFG